MNEDIFLLKGNITRKVRREEVFTMLEKYNEGKNLKFIVELLKKIKYTKTIQRYNDGIIRIFYENPYNYHRASELFDGDETLILDEILFKY